MTNFSEVVKKATRSDHDLVEGSVVMNRLSNKTLTREDYKILLARYYYMYAALEPAIQSVAPSNKTVASLLFEPMLRMNSLQEDVEYFFGKDFLSTPTFTAPKTPAVVAWESNISEIQKSAPHKLVAHMYVRYLGDMFGGQMIGEKIKGGLGLEKDEGAAFYKFAVPSVMVIVKDFKQGLDAVIDDDLQQDILDEITKSYEMQHDILTEVDAALSK